MSLLVQVVLFCLMGGLLSVVAAAAFLLLPEGQRTRALPHFVSYALGALLGAAFLALLPHAIEHPGTDIHALMMAVLAGLLGFFLLEKMVLWRHSHSESCREGHLHPVSEGQAPGVLIIIGDSIHNFVDGVLIGAAFLTDPKLGMVTAIAVAAHEIPQEVGDFAILLQSGFSRARAFWFNLFSGFTTVFGGVLAYYTLETAQQILPYVLAIAASSFIYIAVADLIPGLHRKLQVRATVQQVILITAGVATIYLSHANLH